MAAAKETNPTWDAANHKITQRKWMQMKAATYNLRVDTDYDQEWQWHYRSEAVCSLIDYYDWDVLAIQEARPSQFADLAKLAQYASVTAERDGWLSEGIGLYYQKEAFELLDSGSFCCHWHRLNQYSSRSCVFLCVWAVLQEKNPPFLAITTHLDNISEMARFEGMKDPWAAGRSDRTLSCIADGRLECGANGAGASVLRAVFSNAKEHGQSRITDPKAPIKFLFIRYHGKN